MFYAAIDAAGRAKPYRTLALGELKGKGERGKGKGERGKVKGER